MIKLSIFVLAALCAGCAGWTPSLAARTETDCQSLWKTADKDGDGILAGPEARMFSEVITGAGSQVKDVTGQKIEIDEFLKACQLGIFDKLKVD